MSFIQTTHELRKAANTLDTVDSLLDDRIPILKRRPFFHDPKYLDQHCIDLDRVIELDETSDRDTIVGYEMPWAEV